MNWVEVETHFLALGKSIVDAQRQIDNPPAGGEDVAEWLKCVMLRALPLNEYVKKRGGQAAIDNDHDDLCWLVRDGIYGSRVIREARRNADDPYQQLERAEGDPEVAQKSPAETARAIRSSTESAQVSATDDTEAASEVKDEKVILESLRPAERKAYFAYQMAVSKFGRTLKDREAYDHIRDVDFPDDAGDLGELADYDLPSFDTWSRHLRVARKAMGDQKYTRRAGRTTGGSVVRRDEI